MKKLLVAIMVLSLVALTVPVWAQPNNNNNVQHQECNVSLDANVYLLKLVLIAQLRADLYFTYIFQGFNPAARADAEVVKNDLNKENYLKIGAATLKDEICDSFNYFNGIGQSNQSAGSMNNQGNAVAVAAVGSAKTYASSLAAVGDTNTKNKISVRYEEADGIGGILDSILHRDPAVLKQTDSLKSAFNYFNGIGQSNQSAGSLNNQNNVVSVAAGIVVDPYVGGNGFDFCKDAVAVSGAELALNNTHNRFCVDKVEFTNTITGSFNHFNGIGQSNQSAGNMNNQANVISVAASLKINP